MEMDIEEMKKIRTRGEKEELLVVKLRSEEIRWKIMDRKRRFKKRKSGLKRRRRSKRGRLSGS